MALGARGAQQRPPDYSLCQPPQARIYRSLPSAADEIRGEPSRALSPSRPHWPLGAPARPLQEWRSYCIRCRRGALCDRWICPRLHRRVPSDKHPLPPGQCATPLDGAHPEISARSLPTQGGETVAELCCSLVKDGVDSSGGRRKGTPTQIFLSSLRPVDPTRDALKTG